MLLLALGDLLCGFAKSPAQLYVFRGIAGIGAGGINRQVCSSNFENSLLMVVNYSLVMIMFTDMTTLKQRGKYQGFLECCIAAGNGVGPVVGGAFAESSATWRWAFWFVVPLTVLSAAIILVTSPSAKLTGSNVEKLKMIDYGGMVLSLASVIFLLVIKGFST
jgi:MFS family permease